MRILVQIENGNQKLFTAIKALLNAQPNLKFKIEKFNKISYTPNDETIKAMQECEQGGNSTGYNSYDEFLKEFTDPNRIR